MYAALILSSVLAIDPPTQARAKQSAALEKVHDYERKQRSVPDWSPAERRSSVGDTFKIKDPGRPLVLYIENDREAVLTFGDVDFWLRGVSTKGHITGVRVKLPGLFQISGTDKYGGETIFVVEPYEVPGKPTKEEYRLADLERKQLEKDAAAEQQKRATEAEAAKKVQFRERAEKAAAFRLKAAKDWISTGKKELGVKWLKETIETYPQTEAAKEAKQILATMEK